MQHTVVPSLSILSVRSSSDLSSVSVIRVFLGRWAFCCCWWIVVGFHAMLGAFALSTAALHWYLQKERVYLSMSSLNVPLQTLELTAIVFLLIGMAHVVSVVCVLHHSFLARQLILHTPKKTKKPSRRTPAFVRPFSHFYDVIMNTWRSLFSPTGFFGFSHPHFETIFLFREAWEILLQTYQTYQLSLSVPCKWINRFAVAAVVLNCCSSPLVHLLFRKKDQLRRVFNLIQDAMLDFSCSIIIPLSIFLPYVPLYDTTVYTFPVELILNDVWYINAVSEIRQVLVTSFPDFLSTIMPQLSLLGYLMTFKNLLRRRSLRVLNGPSNRQVRPEPTKRPKFHPSITSRPTDRLHHHAKDWRKALHVMVHALFLLWGAGVLVLHLQAAHNTDREIPGCELHVSAWHSSRFPCSVMVLNCHTAHIQGYANETTKILDLVERSSLRALIFTHCAALHIPSVITEFHDLAGVEVFNSTLVDWPTAAAIRDVTQPEIGYVFFIKSNWTTFPAGLLHDQLPSRFAHFVILASNLTDIPEEIALWSVKPWIDFYLADVPDLHEIPESLCHLDISTLWLINTGMTTLPTMCVIDPQLLDLTISGNAFSELPAVFNPNLVNLYAETTMIEVLPPWFDDWYQPTKTVSFYGSPLCNSSLLQADSTRWNALCGTDWASATDYYPWELMFHLRPFDSPPRS